MTQSLMNPWLREFNVSFALFVNQLPVPCDRLKRAIQYVSLNGGKRMRPALVYLCGELLEVPRDVLNILATAIELIHTYSLVHDDLPAMDNDDFRRGRASAHRAFDEATAILVGDALQSLAFEHLTLLENHLDAKRVLLIVRAIAHAVGPFGMVAGQSLDLTRLLLPDVTLDELKNIHDLKTGRLILACVQSVIHADNRAHQDLHALLLSYARLLGLVFQIQDDYLDQYGSSATLGKTQGLDQANQKITFCSFYNKEALSDLIETSYIQAKNILADAGSAAQNLYDFTDFLHARG